MNQASFQIWPLPRRHLVGMGLLFVLALVIIAPRVEMRQPIFDEVSYLRHAYGLAEQAVFGVGGPGKTTVVASDRMAPGYPALLAVLLSVDSHFRADADCFLSKRKDCGLTFGAVRIVQFVLALITGVLIWIAAARLTGAYSYAHVALGTYFCGVEVLEYATNFLVSENLAIPLTALLSVLLMEGTTRQRPWLLAAAGLCLSALTLTRPAFQFLGPLLVLALLVTALIVTAARRRFVVGAVLFAIFFAIPTGLWMTRNERLFDRFGMTAQNAVMVLAIRASYDRMTPKEWLAGFVYWLPDFGDSLAQRILKPTSYTRLDMSNPEGFRRTGVREWSEAVRRYGHEEAQQMVLQRIIDNPGRHLLVTLPITFRGMFPDKVSIVTVPCLLIVVFSLARRKRFAFVWFAVPALYSLAFHGFVTHNIPRYGMPMVPAAAIGFAVVVMWIVTALASRRAKALNSSPP